MNTFHVSGIHHIAIRAKDFEKTLQFCVRHTWSLPEFHLKQEAMLKLADGSTFIELFDSDADIAAQGRRPLPGEESVQGALLHFSLGVDNAQNAYNKEIEDDARSCVPPMTLTLGNPPLTVRNALIYSSNGEVIEFIEKSDL